MGATAMLPDLPAVPRVSVLTLSYNHERFIAEAIESVLAQGWPADRLQHVVVNDGSTDATAAVLDDYRASVTVIEHDNVGMRASVDRAMRVLDGDVIAVLDGDDVMMPGRVERQVQALQEHPAAGLAYTDAEMIDRDGQLLERSFLDWAGLPRLSGPVHGRLLRANFISGSATMFRGCLKHLVDPLPDCAPWPDYWWAWAISGVAEIVHVPMVGYRYRTHGANQTIGANADLRGNLTKEVPFRQRMLADVAADAGMLTTAELTAGIAALLRMLPVVDPRAAFLSPDAAARRDAQEALERAFAALAADDLHAAALACAGAVASDPRDPALIALVNGLTDRLNGVGRADRERERAPLDALGVRAAAVLVDGDALLESPQLLDAYAARIDGDAAVTLVVHVAPASLALDAERIPQLVADRGLDGDDAPDMLLVSEDDTRLRALAQGADAVLGPDAFASAAPAFEIDDVDSLILLLRHRGVDLATAPGSV